MDYHIHCGIYVLFVTNVCCGIQDGRGRGPLIHGTDRTKFTHYFTERTGQMNAEFKRMRQVCCHVFMEVLPQLVMAVLGLGYYWIFISDG